MAKSSQLRTISGLRVVGGMVRNNTTQTGAYTRKSQEDLGKNLVNYFSSPEPKFGASADLVADYLGNEFPKKYTPNINVGQIPELEALHTNLLVYQQKLVQAIDFIKQQPWYSDGTVAPLFVDTITLFEQQLANIEMWLARFAVSNQKMCDHHQFKLSLIEHREDRINLKEIHTFLENRLTYVTKYKTI